MKTSHIGYIYLLLLAVTGRGWTEEAKKQQHDETPLDDVDTMDDFPMDESTPRSEAKEEVRGHEEDNGSDLSDLNLSDDEEEGTTSGAHQPKETQLYRTLMSAMKRPGMRQKLGQVLPILRSMSPTQRLALATLLTARLGPPAEALSHTQHLASMFGPAQHQKSIAAELLLPISMDIANMFSPPRAGEEGKEDDEPEALELRHEQTRRRELYLSSRKRPGIPSGHNRRNAVVPTEILPPPRPTTKRTSSTKGRRPTPTREQQKRTSPPRTQQPPQHIPVGEYSNAPPSEDDCDFFTKSMCLEVSDYPDDAIMASLYRSKGTLGMRLSDMSMPSNDLGDDDVPQVTASSKKEPTRNWPEDRWKREPPSTRVKTENRQADRRQGDGTISVDGGTMCKTAVKYARPKRARATSGHWKFVVNVGDYTQTLRLEMCMKPHETCSYVTENFRSSCNQVFNYHRLLTWENTRGLHMDIFKVPTCCSCHIDGYAFNFPPRATPGKHESLITNSENFPGEEFAAHDEHDDIPLDHFRPPDPVSFQADPVVFQGAGFQHPLDGLANNFQDHLRDTFNVDQFNTNKFNGDQFNTNQFNGDQSNNADHHLFQSEVPDHSLRNAFLDQGSRNPFRDQFPEDQAIRASLPTPVRKRPVPHRQGFRRPTPNNLTPPPGPPLPLANEEEYPPFTGNQLRRRSNHTGPGLRPDYDLEYSASDPVRDVFPTIITSDAIRSPSPPTLTTPTPPTPPPRSSPPPPAPSATAATDPAGHRRVNYSYHPIIDFFKNAAGPSNNRLEERKGEEWRSEEWKPMVGEGARAATTNSTTSVSE